MAPAACRPTHEPRATEHIAEMIAHDRASSSPTGYAYPARDGNVYFRVRRFAGYGKLSHQRLDDMSAGEGIGSRHKEDAHDFALWKGAKPGEPTWASPWGPGRPGLAHRVLGDGGNATSASRSTSTAAART